MQSFKLVCLLMLAAVAFAASDDLEIVSEDEGSQATETKTNSAIPAPETVSTQPEDGEKKQKVVKKVVTYWKGQEILRDPANFDYSGDNYVELYENDVMVWKDRFFLNSDIHLITNEFYDNEIYAKQGDDSKPWLIMFFRDRFNAHFQNEDHNKINDYYSNLLWITKNTLHGDVNIGYVDTYDNGELIKETFDVDKLPHVSLIVQGKVYIMPFNDGYFWQSNDIIAFCLEDYRNVVPFPLRPRVQPGIPMLVEYASSHLAANYWDETMGYARSGSKMLKETFGIDPEFKKSNPYYGKKHKHRKSQVRTVIEYLLLPVALLLVFVMTLLNCCCYFVCCKSSKPKTAPANKDKSE